MVELGRVAALDVGEKRVGVAISDALRMLARPVEVVAHHPRNAHFEHVEDLVDREHVTLVIVGDPVSLSGEPGPQARAIASYRKALASHLSVPVISWDERYSTVIARDLLAESRGSRVHKGKRGRRDICGDVDAAAAAVILQSYLDSQASGEAHGETHGETHD